MDNRINKISQLIEEIKFFSKMADRHASKGEEDLEFQQYHQKKERLLQALIAEILQADFNTEEASSFIQVILERFHKPILKNGVHTKEGLKEIYRQLAT